MEWTKEKIKYIVKNYKKKGDGIKLAEHFKVPPWTIRDIISKLRQAGVNIPYIGTTTKLVESVEEAAEELKKLIK